MRIQCMGWPTVQARCTENATSVGHGIYLCLRCQENTRKDLLSLRRERLRTERELHRLAETQAGLNQPRPSIYPARGGEILGGRFEEKRSKH